MVLLILISYLVGSIPFGYIFAKFLLKKDVRCVGSHSTGTTNVMRLGKPIIGIATLICDFSKCLILTVITQKHYANEHHAVYVSIILCILGHIFPVWLNFKGGKGVAAVAGAFTALSPCIACISILIWATTLLLTRTSFISSLAFVTAFIVLQLTCIIKKDFSNHIDLAIFLLIVFIIILTAHRRNIKKIINK